MTRLTRLRLMVLWLLLVPLAVAPDLATAQRQLLPQSSSASNDLSEAARLNQQIIRLYGEARYDEAIPLAVRMLAICEKVLGSEHALTALSLNNLAMLYKSKGEYERAVPLYQRALAIREKALGTEHLDTATSLHNLGLLYRDKHEYERAEPLLRRALAIREKMLGTEHFDTGVSLNDLALLYHTNGEYKRAEPLFLRALAIFKKTLGAEHPNTVQSLNNLAMLYEAEGEYERAEPLLRDALAIQEKVSGAEHPNTAQFLNNLAFLYRAKGEYERAEPLYLRALAIREKALGTEHLDTVQILNNLAGLYHAKGEYGRAESLLQRVLAIREKILGREHPDIAVSLNNLAILYESKGENERTEPLHQRALAIYEKTYGAEHPYTALSLNNLAGLYYSQSKYKSAEPLYLRSLAIREKVLGKEHPDTAASMNNLATLYWAKGEYERAELLYLRALAIREKALGIEHPDTAQSLNNLAGLYEAKGEYKRAELPLRRALAICEKMLGAEHPFTAWSLHNLAQLHYSQGEYGTAEPLLQRVAGIQEHNLVQILLTGSEQQKQLYLNTLSSETHFIINFNTRAMPMNEQVARLVLTIILQRKGRALDAMTEQIGILRRRADPQNRQLLDQLLATRTQLATLQVSEMSNIPPEQRRTKIAQLEAAAEKLEAAISSRSAEFRVQIQPITLAGVQQALPTDAALVEFFVYRPFDAKAKRDERFGKPRYVAYALKREGAPKLVDLGEAEAIDRAVAAWRAALRDEGRADVKRLARALDELVMRPVRGLLGKTRRLLISPDGALNLIPFAALVDEQNEYLVKNYAISYLTSGRDLLRLQVARASKQAPLVVADPDFDAPASGQTAAERGQGTKKPTPGTQSSPPSGAQPSSLAQLQVDRLPGTAAEARALKALLPEAVVLTGKQATEAALKQATVPRLLHIATHGFFLEDMPTPPPTVNRGVGVKTSLGIALNPAPSSGGGNPLLRSGLALAGFNLHRGGEDDGVLTALEATGLNLWGTQMVILSACETGVGAVKNGQGVYGLRRALVLAGAETQVMSLWKVSDEGTSELMSEYYRALQRGEGRAEGLRQAQLRWLKDARRSHPYYWASFIQSGEWANLAGKR